VTERPADNQADVAFEKDDVNAGALLKFAFWLVVVTVVIVFLLHRLYFVFVAQEAGRQPPPPIMKPPAAQIAPPRPLLQVPIQPPADVATRFASHNLIEFRAEEDALLGSYGWVDKDLGRVHMPVDDAMRIVAEQGLPSFLPPTPAPLPAPTGKASPAKTGGGAP
jgi:hypothetical protein